MFLLSILIFSHLSLAEKSRSHLRMIDLDSLPSPFDRVNDRVVRSGYHSGDLFSFSAISRKLQSYKHSFFTFVKLKTIVMSSTRSSRIMCALGLSVSLIFLIFFIALQLQRAVIMKAFEDAEKDQPKMKAPDAAVAN